MFEVGVEARGNGVILWQSPAPALCSASFYRGIRHYDAEGGKLVTNGRLGEAFESGFAQRMLGRGELFPRTDGRRGGNIDGVRFRVILILRLGGAGGVTDEGSLESLHLGREDGEEEGSGDDKNCSHVFHANRPTGDGERPDRWWAWKVARLAGMSQTPGTLTPRRRPRVGAHPAAGGRETSLGRTRRARRINRTLAVAYPDADCELDFEIGRASCRERV